MKSEQISEICKNHSKELAVIYCIECNFCICADCAQSHNATFPEHHEFNIQTYLKSLIDQAYGKILHFQPIDFKSLMCLFEEKSTKIKENMQKIQKAIDTVSQNFLTEMKEIQSQTQNWEKEKSEGILRKLEIENYINHGKYIHALKLIDEENGKGNKNIFNHNKIPSILPLTLIEQNLYKISLDLQNYLFPQKNNMPIQQNPAIHILEDGKYPKLHLFFPINNQSKSVEIKYFNLPNFYDSCIIQNTVYITGGYEDLKANNNCYGINIEKIIPNKKITAERKSDMKFSKFNHTLLPISGNLLYSLGGFSLNSHSEKIDLPICESYNLEMNFWEDLPNLNEPRGAISGCLFEKRFVYAFGGLSVGKGTVSNIIEIFDIFNQSAGWVIIKPEGELLPRHSSATIQMSENSILIFGGYNEKSLDSVIEFNTSTNKIIPQNSLPQVSSFQQRKAIIFNDAIFAPDYFYKCVYKYVLRNKEWLIMHKNNWILMK